jgi:hypothetical protein
MLLDTIQNTGSQNIDLLYLHCEENIYEGSKCSSNMVVIEIRGDADWNNQMRGAGGKLVVVDFSATW